MIKRRFLDSWKNRYFIVAKNTTASSLPGRGRITDFWVLEWADNHSHASNYCFEDIAPMPYDISEQEIIWQVDKLLL